MPYIAAAAFLVLCLVLGRPFAHRVLMVTHMYGARRAWQIHQSPAWSALEAGKGKADWAGGPSAAEACREVTRNPKGGVHRKDPVAQWRGHLSFSLLLFLEEGSPFKDKGCSFTPVFLGFFGEGSPLSIQGMLLLPMATARLSGDSGVSFLRMPHFGAGLKATEGKPTCFLFGWGEVRQIGGPVPFEFSLRPKRVPSKKHGPG